jgi:ABC-type branched-subunit amino acid transport system substrate-binding protein
MPSCRRGVATAASLVLGVTLLGACAAQNTDASADGSSTGEAGVPAAAPGFDPEAGTITVGLITALSGPVAPSAAEIVQGQQAWYDKVNAEGGIGGEYTIETVSGDSQFNPQLAVQTYQGMKDDVTLLAQVLGTPSVRALLPILEQDQKMTLAAQDADLRTEPAVLPFLASYQTDVVNAVSYLWHEEQLQGENYCALVTDDTSGEARVQGLESIGEALGFEVGTVTKFAPTDTNFTAQVQQLQSDGCDVVVYGGASNNTSNVVAAATQLQFTPTWISEYFANSQAFPSSPIAEYLEQNFVFTGPGDELDNTDSADMAELIENVRTSAPDAQLSLQHVYGWIQGQVVTAVLEQAVENGDLSGAGIRQAATQVDEVDFGSLGGPITLGEPEDRVLPKQTTIYRYDRTKPYGLAAASVLYQADEGLSDEF